MDVKTYASSTSSHPELFLGKGVLKICSKFTGFTLVFIKQTGKVLISGEVS